MRALPLRLSAVTSLAALSLLMPACGLDGGDANGSRIRLPAQQALALLDDEQRGLVSASIEMSGLSIAAPLSIDWEQDPVALTGRFELCAGRRLFDPPCELPAQTDVLIRVTGRPSADVEETFLIAEHRGSLQLGDPTSEEIVQLDVAPEDFTLCASDADASATSYWDGGEKVRCEPRFDLNQNGVNNLDDFAAGIDPTPAPAFIDTVPRDMQFPSGILLGNFAQEAIVVENLSANPVEVSARVVGAPGASLSRYEGTPHEDDTSRLIRLGTLDPFDQAVLAVSFAPVNPFFTTGAVYVEAKDLVTEVPQRAIIKVIGNADGQLQTPPSGYGSAAPLADDARPGGYDGTSATFPSARLFSGLEVTDISGNANLGGDEQAAGGLPYADSSITAVFRGDTTSATTINASAAFTVTLPPRYTLATTLSGLARESIVGLATVGLSDDDELDEDLSMNVRAQGARGSPSAIELYNNSNRDRRILVVLSRLVDLLDGPWPPVPFKLAVQISKAPIIEVLDPVGGPLEGGVPVTICGRGFDEGAQVLLAGTPALDCAFSTMLEACAEAEQAEHGFSCVTPPGSLEVGKNPATVVVLNPSRENGGDGQAATLPDAYTYEPPAPRLFQLVPDFGAIFASADMAEVTLHGSFFSSRVAPPLVFFGSQPAQSVTFVNSTRLVVVPPVLSAGTIGVTARNVLELADDGTPARLSLFSDQITFRYFEPAGPAPTLSPIDPTDQPGLASGQAGAPRASIDGVPLAGDGSGGIRLDGTGFIDTPRVFVGDQEADVFFVSDTEVRIGVPPLTFPASAVSIRILNPDGQLAELDEGLGYYAPAPVITRVAPSRVTIGTSTFITLEGSGFRPGPEVRLVQRGGTRVILGQNVALTASTPPTIVFSAGALVAPDVGEYDIEIENRAIFTDPLTGGDNLTATWPGAGGSPFSVVAESAPPPRIADVTPRSVAIGSAALIAVDGEDFDPDMSDGLTVLVGVHPAVDVSTDGSVVTFRLPNTVTEAGVYTLRVTNGDGQGDTSTLEAYVPTEPPPSIDEVIPGEGGPGTLVTVNGERLSSPDGSMTVRLGSVTLGPADELTIASGQITFRVPEFPTSAGYTLLNLRIVDPIGQSAIAPFLYGTALGGGGGGDAGVITTDGGGVVPPPAIFEVTPVAGGAGDAVTLRGSGLGTPGSSVRFGTHVLTAVGDDLVLGDSEITFTAPTLSVPANQETSVFITVLDPYGRSASASFIYRGTNVTQVNQPPTVSVADRDVTAGDEVALLATASDPDGTIVRVAWTQVSGQTLALTGADQLQLGFTAPEVSLVESVVFEVEVEDDDGALGWDVVRVNILPDTTSNRPPNVYAGGDQAVSSGELVTLSAIGSDPDGTVTGYSWSQVGGTAVTLDTPLAQSTTFTAPTVACAERLWFEVQVTDDVGATRSDRVSVIVEPDPVEVSASNAFFDFEGDDGDFISTDALWQWGVPTVGPSSGYSGGRVWGTALGGNYPANTTAFLCLPAIERPAGTGRTTFSFRAYMNITLGDGVTLEGLDAAAGWIPLVDTTPQMPTTAGGRPVWQGTPPTAPWWLHTVDLPSWLGASMRVRFVFHSDANYVAQGAYIDDVRVDDEGSDPDGDGIIGVRDELNLLGTDPFVADVDGDGVLDGDEVADGTGPFNPADYSGAPVMLVGETLDADDGPSGVVLEGGLWQHGGVGNGPGKGHDGSSGWGTNLTGNYTSYERAYLYLPPIDLTTAVDPTLSLRMWVSASLGDGLSVERLADGAWQTLSPYTPAYDATDGIAKPAWRTHVPADGGYTLALLPLGDDAGGKAHVRISFRSDLNYAAVGAYVDEIGVHEEGDDPDADGLVGIYDELAGFHTNPFTADSDDDSSDDGAEIGGATDPNNPADYPGADMLLPGEVLDFDDGPGGMATKGPLWEHGTVGNGPGTGFMGASAWATSLTGNYGANKREYLYLPPVDLRAATDPTLAMRIWVNCTLGDGLSVERWVGGDDWQAITPFTPAYDATDGAGKSAWRTQAPYSGEYVLALLSLDADLGSIARLRITFRSDQNYVAPGAYVDEVGVIEEGADPDGDGLLGAYTELSTYGTDPFVADTDGDGVDDGTEIDDGTDPLQPTDYVGAPVLAVGELLDFELDDGGAFAPFGRWELGSPGQGPLAAHSGGRAWATGLTANYGANLREPLLLAPLDLTTATAPLLTMRVWVSANLGDGLSVEAQNQDGTWTKLLPLSPAYESTDALGGSAWRNQGTGSDYVLASFDVAARIGQQVPLRLMFRSDQNYAGNGAFVDDVGLAERASDPDGDGLTFEDEVEVHGTAPWAADTDGDGVNDGDEVTAMTDPLDPLDS